MGTPLSSEGRLLAVKGEGRAGSGRPGRHDVAVAVQRPSSSCVQGTTTRGGVEKLQRGTGAEWAGGAVRARLAAGGVGVQHRIGERERKERVERERNLTDSNLNFSPNFQLTLEKF